MGGNNAIVGAAALASALTRRLDANPAGLSAADITAAFAETEKARKPKMIKVMEAANKQHDRETLTSLATRILMPRLIRFATVEARFDPTAAAYFTSESVEQLPIPKRPRYVPYADELPAKPLPRSRLYRLAAAAVFGFLFYLSFLALRFMSGLPETFRADEKFKTWSTGAAFLDNMLPVFVRVFSPMVTGHPDPVYALQLIYFLPVLIPVLTIWTAEAYRRGNNQTYTGRLVSV